MNGTLTRITGGKALRTYAVDGEFLKWPEVGKCFHIVGKSLTAHGSHRLVTTSPVVSVESPNAGAVQFRTETGSVYEIKQVWGAGHS